MNSEQIANMLAEQDESGYFKKALRLNKDLADLGSKFATFLPSKRQGAGTISALATPIELFKIISKKQDKILDQDEEPISNESFSDFTSDFSDSMEEVASIQRNAAEGLSTFTSSFASNITDLSSQITGNIQEGASGIRSGAEDFLELRENNVTNALLSATDTIAGKTKDLTLGIGRTLFGGGKDVGDLTLQAVNRVGDAVEQGNQQATDTLNTNLTKIM